MKTREIVVNEVYSNGKGRTRTVTALLPDYRLYQWMSENADCVEYKVSLHNTSLMTCKKKMTVVAFARWAKERIS